LIEANFVAPSVIMSRSCIVFGSFVAVALAQPDACLQKCKTKGSEGCCRYVAHMGPQGLEGCLWCPQGSVDGASHTPGDAAANCPSPSKCDGWNWDQACKGSCAPISPTPTPTPTPAPPPTPHTWVLDWQDEFDNCPGGLPDPNVWDYELRYVRNNEYQWYTDKNAACENGNLVITAKREHAPDAPEKFQYTSSSITTKKSKSWIYGKFEIRAKIPIEKGSWPAWWFLGTPETGEWPYNGEIDVMEYYADKNTGTPEIRANFICCSTNWEDWNSNQDPVDSAWASSWHTYVMERDPNEIRIYRDGNQEPVARQKVDADSPWRNPMYMIINLAIGGQNGGDPSGTDFPLKLEVDYVKVYKDASSTFGAAQAIV